jgi:xylulokinase
MDKLILTYDIGTTGNKCTLFDSKGKNICSHTVPYDTIYPKPGWSEQRPEDFWESVILGTRAILGKGNIDSANIAVIGLSGHMNGCLPVDRAGTPLFNEIIHSDCRTRKECDQIRRELDDLAYYNITGNRIDPHYSLPKILWLKNNYPHIYKNTAYFLSSKDYISFKLTGNLGVTDFSDASLTGVLDINERCWSTEIIDGLGLDAGKFPQLKSSYHIAGYITQEVAGILGLTQGVPVVVGGGDGACATKGAGVVKRLQAYNYIGSSSWICMLNDKPVLDKIGRLFNYYDLDGENCNVCGTVQCACVSYDWVLNNIGKYEIEQCTKDNKNIFDYIDGITAKVPIGSNGVFFLPYLMGERTPLWDENTKGGFIGFTLFNNRQDLFRATYEGIAYALRNVLDVYEENGLLPDKLTLIGGGAKSLLWNDIMCNIYRKPVMIHKHPREATSLGAAIAAGVGVGIFKDFSSAADTIEYSRILEPDTDKVEEYKKFYSIYLMMYPQLKPIFDEISRATKSS